MRVSAIIALVLGILVAAWLFSGQLGDRDRGGGSSEHAANPPEALPLTRVKVEHLVAQPHSLTLPVRGRTEANRRVVIRAETEGRVVELLATRGLAVRKGDLLGRIAVEEREARLAEYRARLRQHQLHYEATAALSRKGLSSKEALAAAQANIDAAKAAVEQVEVDISRTRFRAPFDGIIVAGHAEVGDYLRKGDRFALIIDLDPVLIVGSVTERAVAMLRPGLPAVVTSVGGGHRATGTLRYIAPSADPEARTYRIEVEVSNPGGVVRAGHTADISIEVETVLAHFVSPALLTLADDGRLGIKTVEARNRVRFRPVEIVEDAPQGIWLTGLPREVAVITVGQEFVAEGQEVEAAAVATSSTASPAARPPIPASSPSTS